MVTITNLNRDACSAADGQPSKKSKKGGGTGSVASVKESVQLGCVSQDAEPPKQSILRKSGKLGSNRTVTFSNRTWHHIKFGERKGPSKKPEEREFVVDSGAPMHMLSKMGFKLRRSGNPSKVQEPHNGDYG